MLNIYHSSMATGAGRSDVHLHQTPMFHAVVDVRRCSAAAAFGGHVVTVPFFDPFVVLRALEQHRRRQVTMMVPTMISLLLESSRVSRPTRCRSLTRSHLRRCRRCRPRTRSNACARCIPTLDLWQGYGMTECCVDR